MHALNHVAAGGIHVPAEALPQLFETLHNSAQQGNKEKTHEKRRFTPRQLEVVKLLCKGKPNKIIAYELDMQESTVKVHVREIMKKLKVTNRTEAALRAGQLLADLGEVDAQDVEEAAYRIGKLNRIGSETPTK
jgi:DNA-binding NarL/FixJ family response regulator